MWRHDNRKYMVERQIEKQPGTALNCFYHEARTENVDHPNAPPPPHPTGLLKMPPTPQGNNITIEHYIYLMLYCTASILGESSDYHGSPCWTNEENKLLGTFLGVRYRAEFVRCTICTSITGSTFCTFVFLCTLYLIKTTFLLNTSLFSYLYS